MEISSAKKLRDFDIFNDFELKEYEKNSNFSEKA